MTEGLFCYVWREVCDENVGSLVMQSDVSELDVVGWVQENDLWIATVLATTLPFVCCKIWLD